MEDKKNGTEGVIKKSFTFKAEKCQYLIFKPYKNVFGITLFKIHEKYDKMDHIPLFPLEIRSLIN